MPEPDIPFGDPQSAQKLLELYQIVGQRIAAVTLETTTVNTTTYADKSGTTFAERTKIILTFGNDSRVEIMQEIPQPTEI